MLFRTLRDNKKKVRFFRKVKEGVLNASHSLYLPIRFHKGFYLVKMRLCYNKN